VLVTVAIGLLLDRKAPILPRPETLAEPPKPSPYAAGEAAATAIRAGDTQLAKLRTSQRCPSCRGAMTHESDDPVRYDERELLVLHFRCPRCAAPRSLYVEPVTSR
jgi:hypothetical protein